MDKPFITDFDNYRGFLKSYYEFQKTNHQKYSYRKLALDLGFKASNYFHLIISNKRSLSLEAVSKIASALSFKAKEKRYFETLVYYNDCELPAEKEKYKKQLEKIVGKKNKLIAKDQYSYFSQWYLPVIREILALKGFVSNLNWISKKLKPRIDETKVKKAINDLEKLKMVKKVRGQWTQSEEHVGTEVNTASDVIYDYHQKLIQLALKALDDPVDERDIAAMTVSLNREQFKWLQNRVREFRSEILAELETTKKPATLVCQLNMQLFKTTKD